MNPAVSSENVFYQLYNTLKENIFQTRITSTSEIATRCAFCGDSVKNINHCHMYIGFNHNSNLLVFYCQRCNVKGIINNTFLNAYNITDISLKSIITELYRTAGIKSSILKRTLSRNEGIVLGNLNYDFSRHARTYPFKYNYLENRIGEITDARLKKIRVIFSIYDYLNEQPDLLNKIDQEDEYLMAKLEVLENYYIGFPTTDGSRINFRCCINDDELRRYDALKLEDSIFPPLYTIANRLNLNRPIEINLAEGAFDIINVHYLKNNDKNALYGAVFNKDYATKILELIRVFGTIRNISHINIYSDDDVNLRFLERQFKNNSYIWRKIFVYKSNDKDFGEISNLSRNFITVKRGMKKHD
jgi:hypothetical protein